MSNDEPSQEETELKVDGMTCRSCVRHVEGALRALDGVSAIEVALADARVRVAHDPSQASVEALVRALAEAGYPSRRA